MSEKIKPIKSIERGIILNGEIYEAIEGSCKDCAFCENCILLKEGKFRCSPLCEGFEYAGGFISCAFKKVESAILKNTKSLDGDISKLVDDNFFDLV